jgi:hypothetical protein
MTRNLCMLIAVALVGCKDKGGDTGPGGDVGCGVEVETTFPADQTPNAYYRSAIEWQLSDADATAVASLTDSSGAAVAGTSTVDPDTDVVYFTPSEALASGATYTASLSFCAGNPSISFTTSELGGAVDEASLVGMAYEVNLNDARFIEPAGVADLLLSQLENSIIIGVDAVTPGSSIQMIGAISGDGVSTQDYCTPTIDFPEASFTESPYFSIGPKDTDLTVAGVTLTISQLVLNGTFAPDGSYIGGAELSGELDARVLAPVLGDLIEESDPDYVCDLVAGFGVSCEACSSDGELYCISVLADSITATQQTESVQEVAEEDCHPECAASYKNKECDTSGW